MPSTNSVLTVIFSLIFAIIFITPFQKIEASTSNTQPDPKVTQGYEMGYLWIRAARDDTILGKVDSIDRRSRC